MAYNSLSVKSKPAGPSSTLRVASSNSSLRPPRTPNKPPQHQSQLSLQTVIGTTTKTPNGFSCHDQSRSFALCAGSAAVLAELDDENKVAQRFFRARPSATSVNPVTSFYNPSTPPTTPDTRSRSVSGMKPPAYTNAYNGSPSTEIPEAGSPRAWSSRERVKAVTSVAISPNGRLLAVGETGYSPRVMIFSTAKDSACDVPLSILTEHTFGVRSLAFGPNSQFLATLGDVNDGFLFVWSVSLKTGSARLHSTNKCTAFVRDMRWMGQSLVTVGVRHVKVWRLPDSGPPSPSKSRFIESNANPPNPAPKALSGRNCVLGPLADSTFTSVVSISDHEAIVGTDSGALCLLDDSERSPKLSLVKQLEFGVTSLAVDLDQTRVWVGGRGRQMISCSFESLRSPITPSRPGSSCKSPANNSKRPAITCMGSLSSHLVTIDDTKAAHIYDTAALKEEIGPNAVETALPGHTDSVLGIGPLRTPNDMNADFFTWSCNGMVKFWDSRGTCQKSRDISSSQLPKHDEDTGNELKVLRATDDMGLFVSGDKMGILRVFDGESWKCSNEARAHGGEITDIALHSQSGACLIATSGRDRMVQLFQKTEESLELIQTMDEHVGSVGQLLFVEDGAKLLSCSADRTILIRERVIREVDAKTATAYLISRVITMRSSPVSMALSDDPNILIVSTADRCIQQYDITTGRHIQSFRAADAESNDTVVMTSLSVAPEIVGQSPKLLLGVSATDKSIRIYDMERSVLLTGELGHTEGISSVHLLEKRPNPDEDSFTRTLVSTGMDGIVMIWNITVQPLPSQDLTQSTSRPEEDTPCKDSTLSRPPLRKILSRSEIAGFQKQENMIGSPTPMREQSPPLIRRLSRFSLASSYSKSGSPAPATPPSASAHRSPIFNTRPTSSRRSPSPPSPKSTPARNGQHTNGARQSSLDFRPRTRTSRKSEFGSLNMSTEQACRTLRAYRKKLNGSSEPLHSQKELERELNLTLRALNSRTKRCESAEPETDSSGKENERTPAPPVPKETAHVPHRTPSTPNLSQKKSPKTARSLSLDADGEG